MSNINLYQADDEKLESGRKSFALDGGFIFAVSIFLLVLLALGGAKLASSSFEKKTLALDAELKEASATFTGNDINRIVDFDTRVSEAVDNISTKPDTTEIFAAIESVMMENVKATEILYDSENGKVAVSAYLRASNFEDIAKQILNFKLSERFSGVFVADIASEGKGISFLIKTNFK